MRMSYLSKTLGAAVTFGVLATASSAVELDASLDSNGDGMWSFPELQVGFPELTDDLFTTMDTSGDGLIDTAEAAVAVDAGLIVPAES